MNIHQKQEKQLFDLIRTAADTKFGQEHEFKQIQRYPDFREEVPISFYKNISNQIEQLKSGSADLLWPGQINNFAVSAGTSGKGKHLPLSRQRLQSDRRFMRMIALQYLKQNPNIFDVIGTHISLPGVLEQKGNFQIGEISAFTALKAPWWLTPLQLFDSNELTNLSFDKKIDRVLEEGINHDVRVITAAPNWVLTIFQELLKKTGKEHIKEIWPNLSLLICGGVKLANYRPHLEKLIGNKEVHFIETYGASEGYIGFSSHIKRDDLKLVTNNGIFFEFIPNPLPDPASMSIQEAVPLWEVEPDTPYALLVTTNAGLWRYALNDIIEFTQLDPPRIKVMGRVSEMLDDYGEALYAYEAEEALQQTADSMGLTVGKFTVGAQMGSEQDIPRHFWFIQTDESLHSDTLDKLAKRLDDTICQMNRHYTIRRENNTLGQPQIYTISQQQVNNWLQQKGKEKAQGKLPAILRKDRDINYFKGSQ